MNGDEWLYPEMAEPTVNGGEPYPIEQYDLPTVDVLDIQTDTMEFEEAPPAPVVALKPSVHRPRVMPPRWSTIRPRSFLNMVPNVVFYPVVLGSIAYALVSGKVLPRGYGLVWFFAGAVACATYRRASDDAARVMRGEWSWDEWERAHPFMRHLWAFLGRFAV